MFRPSSTCTSNHVFRSTTTLTQCSALRVVQVYLRSHFNPFKTTLWWWHEDDISFPVHRLWDLELLFNRNSFIHSLTFLICWLMVKLRTFALMPTLSMERSVAKCKALFWVTWKWPTKRYVLSITPSRIILASIRCQRLVRIQYIQLYFNRLYGW